MVTLFLKFWDDGIVFGWSVNITVNTGSFFVSARQESHEHVTGSQFQGSRQRSGHAPF